MPNKHGVLYNGTDLQYKDDTGVYQTIASGGSTYALVGPGETYTTLISAVLAGEQFIHVVGNTIETNNFTLNTKHIIIDSGVTVDMQGFTMLYVINTVIEGKGTILGSGNGVTLELPNTSSYRAIIRGITLEKSALSFNYLISAGYNSLYTFDDCTFKVNTVGGFFTTSSGINTNTEKSKFINCIISIGEIGGSPTFYNTEFNGCTITYPSTQPTTDFDIYTDNSINVYNCVFLRNNTILRAYSSNSIIDGLTFTGTGQLILGGQYNIFNNIKCDIISVDIVNTTMSNIQYNTLSFNCIFNNSYVDNMFALQNTSTAGVRQINNSRVSNVKFNVNSSISIQLASQISNSLFICTSLSLGATSDKCIITGCRVENTGGTGEISLALFADNNIITSCSTQQSIINNGTGNVLANNLIAA